MEPSMTTQHVDMSSPDLAQASTASDINLEGRRFVRTETGLSSYRGNAREDAWSERNLLSLDGGGIRGYWTLLVLKRLMKAIGDEERRQAQMTQKHFHSFWPQNFPDYVTQTPFTPEEERKMRLEDKDIDHCDALRDARKFLPCHYFDIICGSSTGSLIAIMLSRFRMTVVDCLDEYEKMGHRIFGKPRPISQRNIGIVPWPKYSAGAMERVFKDVTERRRQRKPNHLDTSRATFPTVAGTCSTFVTTKRRTKGPEASSETTFLIRSYHHPEKKNINKVGVLGPRRETMNYGDASTMEVWEVARAATAAPMYFKEIKLRSSMSNQSTKVYFSDGGFGHINNPTQLGIQEIETLHGKKSVGVVVSVGTARADDQPGGKSIFKRVKQAFNTATNPQHVADQLDGRGNYWRFNDDKGLKIELDDWKPSGKFTRDPGQDTITTIKNEFNRWARKRSNIRALEECARELVRRRRERMENGAKWERFAMCAQFRCLSDECSSRRFDDRSEFEAHYDQKHADYENAADFKDPAVEFWNYQQAS